MAANQVSVSSLETLALKAVNPDEMLKFLADVWTSPFRQQYWPNYKQTLSLTEMERLSKTLPWDHPGARDLDFTVHKKRMQGKRVFFCLGFYMSCRLLPSLITHNNVYYLLKFGVCVPLWENINFQTCPFLVSRCSPLDP